MVDKIILKPKDQQTLKFIEDWMSQAISDQRFGSSDVEKLQKANFKAYFLRERLKTILSADLRNFITQKYNLGVIILGAICLFTNFIPSKDKA